MAKGERKNFSAGSPVNVSKDGGFVVELIGIDPNTTFTEIEEAPPTSPRARKWLASFTVERASGAASTYRLRVTGRLEPGQRIAIFKDPNAGPWDSSDRLPYIKDLTVGDPAIGII